jgi:hypothetical protein
MVRRIAKNDGGRSEAELAADLDAHGTTRKQTESLVRLQQALKEKYAM